MALVEPQLVASRPLSALKAALGLGKKRCDCTDGDGPSGDSERARGSQDEAPGPDPLPQRQSGRGNGNRRGGERLGELPGRSSSESSITSGSSTLSSSVHTHYGESFLDTSSSRETRWRRLQEPSIVPLTAGALEILAAENDQSPAHAAPPMPNEALFAGAPCNTDDFSTYAAPSDHIGVFTIAEMDLGECRSRAVSAPPEPRPRREGLTANERRAHLSGLLFGGGSNL